MQPALLSLLLIALQVSAPVNCRPRLLQAPGRGGPAAGAHASAGVRRPYGPVRRGRNFLVILPLRTPTSNFVSIFDLRKKRFLCMDFRGELFNSQHRDRDDCLFQHIWLTNQRDAFYSASSGRLLTLGQVELQESQRGGPSALMERLRTPLTGGQRKRRSDDGVNPSDPLRTQSHSPHAGKDADPPQPEQDQAGAVSKETIASCDDPLKVLQPNAPQSPVKSRADQAEQS